MNEVNNYLETKKWKNSKIIVSLLKLLIHELEYVVDL